MQCVSEIEPSFLPSAAQFGLSKHSHMIFMINPSAVRRRWVSMAMGLHSDSGRASVNYGRGIILMRAVKQWYFWKFNIGPILTLMCFFSFPASRWRCRCEPELWMGWYSSCLTLNRWTSLSSNLRGEGWWYLLTLGKAPPPSPHLSPSMMESGTLWVDTHRYHHAVTWHHPATLWQNGLKWGHVLNYFLLINQIGMCSNACDVTEWSGIDDDITVLDGSWTELDYNSIWTDCVSGECWGQPPVAVNDGWWF